MVSWFSSRRCSPIGVDLGARSLKLLQMDSEYRRIQATARWDLPAEGDPAARPDLVVDGLKKSLAANPFRGREAVICLTAPNLFIQNVRVAKGSPEEFQRHINQETAGRLPFPITEAEIRFLEAGDVRQGEAIRREVIVLAVQQKLLEQQLDLIVRAGLRPVAVDAEPAALLRCYARQFRRDEDRRQRAIFVGMGAVQTSVVIAEGQEALLIKYLEIGGSHLDEAVMQALRMPLAEASALRRHNGDRRAEQQDPEIARSITEAVRPVIDNLAAELSKCIRYHSVTFRGQPLARLVLGGGEASPSLVQALTARLAVKCELGEPLRTYESNIPAGRGTQWDVATGLALRGSEIES